MVSPLPKTAQEFMAWDWAKIEPYFRELAERPLTAQNVNQWLAEWSHLAELIYETSSRLYVATTVNTADAEAETRYTAFIEHIDPPARAAEQKLKEKLLASKLEPKGFEIPLRNIRSEAAIFREANLPLITEENKLGIEYNKIRGAQTVQWEGEEVTLTKLSAKVHSMARPDRERAWRLIAKRWLQDREAINALWPKFMRVRIQMAKNADYGDFRAYTWELRQRFDYTPDDCLSFHKAIETVVVPAATHIYERHKKRIGVDRLRPWDLARDDRVPIRQPALTPYRDVAELESKSAAIFKQVDPGLGEYFETMRREKLLDLENRKGKAPGGYCTDFPVAKRPFIFMNAAGLHDDVQTMLHEAGHAFHNFEASRLAYYQQKSVNTEFAEVASMSMELLASPYLASKHGGFYSEKDAARARAEHLEDVLTFWPYMAVVDAFQHWIYTNAEAAMDPANCDKKWAEIWKRFMPGVDWSGLEQEMMTGWHRKLHIHLIPFYYVEYGLAQLGSAQVWRGSLSDQKGAVSRYQKALALGGTVTLPKLYEAAGAKFAFDAETMREAVTLIEKTVSELEAV